MGIEIYCDDLQEGTWFSNLSPHLAHAHLLTIRGRGSNPVFVEKLLRYDRPDIVLVVDENPKLVVEKTSEVPTGHNIGQRFGRMVNAVEEGVAVAYFLPFKAMKHGQYAGVCYVNARLFSAFAKMEEIHAIPVLAIEWPCDHRFELVRDGTEDRLIQTLIEQLCQADFDYRRVPAISTVRDRMTEEYAKRVRQTPSYQTPPPTVTIARTPDFLNSIGNKMEAQGTPESFLARPETLTY